MLLKGKITSADGKPLDGATIYLNRIADSTLVKASMSEKDGNFVFAGLKASDYRIMVSVIGYKTYKGGVIKLQRDTILPAIVMQRLLHTHIKPLMLHNLLKEFH